MRGGYWGGDLTFNRGHRPPVVPPLSVANGITTTTCKNQEVEFFQTSASYLLTYNNRQLMPWTSPENLSKVFALKLRQAPTTVIAHNKSLRLVV